MLYRLSRHVSLGFKSRPTLAACGQLKSISPCYWEWDSLLPGTASQTTKSDAYRLVPPTLNFRMPLQLPKLIVPRHQTGRI